MELPAKLGEFECQGFELLRTIRRIKAAVEEKAKTDAMDAMDKALGKI